MFYNDQYMKSLWLILFQPLFIAFLLDFFLLLGFCSKNLDLLDQQIAHLDFCLITLFVTVIATFLEPTLSVSFLHFKQ